MTSGFCSPEFEQGLEDYMQLAVKGYMPILRERSSLGTITSGKSSIIITRRPGISSFKDGKKRVAVKTLSVPKTGPYAVNYLGGVNLTLLKGGGDKPGALRLLKWLTGAENQVKYAVATGVFPALEASFESFLLSSPARLREYTHIIAAAYTLPNHMVSGTVMEVLAGLLSTLATAIVKNKYGKELLKAEIKKADAEVANILRLYHN
jgi:ABC-type glycerol-3-phosphate transport system substrate-binding protein